jgi:hypothetical protein
VPFIPVYLCIQHCIIIQFYLAYALKFSPIRIAVDSVQSFQILYAMTGGNGFDVFDFSYYFEIHAPILSIFAIYFRHNEINHWLAESLSSGIFCYANSLIMCFARFSSISLCLGTGCFLPVVRFL